ncbi:MAG TPA: hypothetical protein VH353_00720 [Caulobacteraceae bacterium]|jgi:hypothetical protein|nr:hypothetical protein [Caulobacteraceae bacterium]
MSKPCRTFAPSYVEMESRLARKVTHKTDRSEAGVRLRRLRGELRLGL